MINKRNLLYFLFFLILFSFTLISTLYKKNNISLSPEEITVKRTMNYEMYLNEEQNVSLSIDLRENNVETIVIGEKIPPQFSYKGYKIFPQSVQVNFISIEENNEFAWIFPSLDENIEIIYFITPTQKGNFSFYGKYGMNVSGILLDEIIKGSSSVSVINPSEEEQSEERTEKIKNICEGPILTETNDIKKKNTVYYNNTAYTDYCSEGVVVKYYCDSYGNIASRGIECHLCEDGICINQFPSCINEEIKNYICEDNSSVRWCVCSDGEWNCIPSPENNCSSPKRIFYFLKQIRENKNLQNYKIVIGKDSLPQDSIAAVEIAGILRIKEIIFDDDVKPQDSIISVGGNCVNKKSADLMGVVYDKNNCLSLAQEKIPFNSSVIEIIEKNNLNHLLVAGWYAEDTRRAARAIVKFNELSNNLNKNRIIIKGNEKEDIDNISFIE